MPDSRRFTSARPIQARSPAYPSLSSSATIDTAKAAISGAERC